MQGGETGKEKVLLPWRKGDVFRLSGGGFRMDGRAPGLSPDRAAGGTVSRCLGCIRPERGPKMACPSDKEKNPVFSGETVWRP